METRVSIIPCWTCGGTGRRNTATFDCPHIVPCPTCKTHGRLRITYEMDADGEMTQRVEPQPDAPLPAPPHYDKVKKDREKQREGQ